MNLPVASSQTRLFELAMRRQHTPESKLLGAAKEQVGEFQIMPTCISNIVVDKNQPWRSGMLSPCNQRNGQTLETNLGSYGHPFH